tara:strand:+ start:145 stop:411 length:267 start_codon:yes stop_codon:yes gene_type:complete
MKPQPDAYVYNEGRSRLILHYADINQAYIVYREDGIHTNCPFQGNVRVHNQYSDAKADYDGRVAAIEHMDAFINNVEQEAEELFGGDI